MSITFLFLFLNLYFDTYGLQQFVKTTFDNSFKVVFFIGVEGSGHHLWNHNFMNQCKKKLNCPFVYNEKVSNNFMCMGAKMMDDDLSMLKQYKKCKQNLKQELLNMKIQYQNGSILSMVSGQNMLSFANWNGQQKFAQYPATIELIEICEYLKIDLRLIYLRRHYADILQSTIKRKIGKTPIRQARSLEISASLILRDLSMIDPRYFICTDFDNMFNNYDYEKELNFINTKNKFYSTLEQSIFKAREFFKNRKLEHKVPESVEEELPTIQLQRTLEFIELKICTLSNTNQNLNIYLVN